MDRREELIKAKADVDAWNKACKVGQAVTGKDPDGTAFETTTRTQAMERGYQAVVWLKDRRGPWALDELKPKD